MKSPRQGQAGFFRQVLLIAIPLAILSLVALLSLRLDRAAIERDAREHAQALAPELAELTGQNLSKALQDLPDRLRQGLMIRGQIVYPIDYPRVPVPPDWPAKLSSEQTKLWRTAEEVLFQKKDMGAARYALTAMRSTELQQAALANVEFCLLLLNSDKDNPTTLVRQFVDLARRSRSVCTESGTPLADLALIQALRHVPAQEPLPDSLKVALSEQVQDHPSFMTSELVEVASKAQPDVFAVQRERWVAEEDTRTLLHALLQQPSGIKSPGEMWIEDRGRDYLALCSPVLSAATHALFLPSRRVEELFHAWRKSRSNRCRNA